MKRLAPVLVLPILLAARPPASPAEVGKGEAGLVLPVGGGHLKVAFCADDVVRVAFSRDPAFFDRPSLAAGVRRCGAPSVERADAGGKTTLSTPKMKVQVDLRTGEIAFLDAQGQPVLVEKEGGRFLAPVEVQGERTFHVRQQWRESDEALYGLGQHQLGLLDLKGCDLDLWQRNATVVVPFLVSSRGSSSTRTAVSGCGWTIASWPTTGGRAGSRGSTSPECRSRGVAATG